MADSKISAFASGAPLVGTDEFVIARAGANFKVTATNIATFIGSTFAQWQADATLATYITPISFSNQTLPGILRLGSSSTTEAFTQEWQNGGGLGGGAIFTSLDSGNTGYFQWFQDVNRCFQAGYTGSGGRVAINSNSFTGGASGGYTGNLHIRTVDAATQAGLLITSPTTPSNSIHVIRVADAANVFWFMDNTGRSYAPNGSAALPSWSFLNDQDCGLYRVTTNELAIATNAARLVGFNATQVVWPTGKEAIWYNTADETTNYERVRASWTSNVFALTSEALGTGTVRMVEVAGNLQGLFSIYRPITTGSVGFFFAQNDSIGNKIGYCQFSGVVDSNTTGAAYGFWRLSTRQNGALTNIIDAKGYCRGSSSIDIGYTLNCIVNQSGTAGYTANLLAITETATGSGTKLAEQITVGGSQIYAIDTTGAVTAFSYLSSNPSGGTAAVWKFGEAAVATITPDRTLRVEVAGTAYLIDAQLA